MVLQRRRDRDDVVDPGDAVRVRPLVRRLAIRSRRRQPVQLGARDVAQRPADQPLAGTRARQPDPHSAEDTGIALDREPQRRPGVRRVRDRQLVDRGSHLPHRNRELVIHR
jgi:hypothetical protein